MAEPTPEIIKQRAMSDAQKQQRRQVIVDYAWQVFQQNEYAAINMVEIAQGVKLAKGTVYLYFETKESLFLTVLDQQFTAWFEALYDFLRMGGTLTTVELVRYLTDSLAVNPALIRLFAISHTILERNISLEAAIAYKRGLMSNVMQGGTLLEAKLPFLKAGQGAELLMRAYALVIGVDSQANPAPIAAEAIATTPELQAFSVSFTAEFSQMLSALIDSYQRQVSP